MVELLVALFIFVFAVGASFATFQSSAQLAEAARNRMIALQDANKVMEEIKAVQLTQVPGINLPQFKTQVLNQSAQWVNALTNEAIALTTNPTPISGSTALATVTVTVSWEDIGRRAQSLRMTAQKSAY